MRFDHWVGGLPLAYPSTPCLTVRRIHVPTGVGKCGIDTACQRTRDDILLVTSVPFPTPIDHSRRGFPKCRTRETEESVSVREGNLIVFPVQADRDPGWLCWRSDTPLTIRYVCVCPSKCLCLCNRSLGVWLVCTREDLPPARPDEHML